ncbi:hypothetical protein [Thalassotalea castellviae]|uniref:Molecular chaperone n=1 Tax=Thalassotalea castellviae TaxID=3075612 RepID=A0ABU2ZZ33_9GAMM|nr:hypothetical protein [Thalassotalea sp. W431]MDT0602810.1 hypothetical protein [Thalassotalea sp. W431]
MIKNKIPFIVLVLTSLWIISDISSRLMVTTELVNKDNNNTIITDLTLPMVTSQTRDAIELKYLQWQKEPESDVETSTPNKMTLEQQALQNGELSSVYAGTNNLVLKAIVIPTAENNETSLPIALIQVEDLTSGVKKIEEFSTNSEVYGYQLTIVNNTQILLSNAAVDPTQKIQLTLYKNVAKN